MPFKKINTFLTKERDRIIFDPKKQGLVVAIYLMIFISLPAFFIFDGNNFLIFGSNFLYSVISFFSILFCDFIFNKILFKNKWSYKREIFALFLMFFYAFVFIYIITKTAVLFYGSSATRRPITIFFTFLVAIAYTLICYSCLKIYQLIYLRKKPIENEMIKYISIDYKGNMYKLNNNEIILIEAFGNYIKIYKSDKNNIDNIIPIVVRQTLKNINEIILNNKIDNLIKCHRSYIVNINKVTSIKKQEDKKQYLNLVDTDIKVPIAKGKLDYFKNFIINYETVKFS